MKSSITDARIKVAASIFDFKAVEPGKLRRKTNKLAQTEVTMQSAKHTCEYSRRNHVMFSEIIT